MRVLHILDSLNRGGTEMLELDLCRNAAANGLDLLFAATGGGDLDGEFASAGVPFRRFVRRAPLDRRLIRDLRELVDSEGIRIVHCHQAVEALHAYFATRGRTPVRRVLSFHLCKTDLRNRAALKLLVPRMDANIAVSQELLKCLEQERGLDTTTNFHVVHNGVDLARLATRGNVSTFRNELRVSAKTRLLGMVGNFYADGRKDQLTVCLALPKIVERFPDLHFVFTGGFNEAGKASYDRCVAACHDARLSERVSFLGKREDVTEILAALDLFVFSSRYDSFGIALVEAMLAGVPAVVSDIPPLIEVASGSAALFQTGDAEDLARVIIELLENDDVRTSLAVRGRERAQREFTIWAHIDKLKKLYASL